MVVLLLRQIRRRRKAGLTKTWAREWSSTCDFPRRLEHALCCRHFAIQSAAILKQALKSREKAMQSYWMSD